LIISDVLAWLERVDSAMEATAAEYLDIGNHVTGPQPIGNGGELVVRTQEAMATIPGVLDTVRQSPDMLSASASRERLELTANSLAMAVDAATSIPGPKLHRAHARTSDGRRTSPCPAFGEPGGALGRTQ